MGLHIPEVPLYELGPDNKPVEVNPRDLFAGKLGILCSVPGAFTPVCTAVSPFPMVFMHLTNSFKPVAYQNTRSAHCQQFTQLIKRLTSDYHHGASSNESVD